MSTPSRYDQIENSSVDESSAQKGHECAGSLCYRDAALRKEQECAREKTEPEVPGDLWSPVSHQSTTPPSYRPSLPDVEVIETSFDHVLLKIENADCACCAKKIFKYLDSVPGVSGLRTNPILLQVEFDLDTAKTSVADMIDLVRNATGHNCERIVKNWHEIEAIVPDGFEKAIGNKFPNGVKDLLFTSKNLVLIRYDAEVVGARDLLMRAFETQLSLAPARTHDEASSQRRKTAFLTFISSILTIPVLILSWAPLPSRPITYGSISLAMATLIQVVIARPFYSVAIRSMIVARTIDINILVVLSTTVAYLVSVISFICVIRGLDMGMGFLFETSALLVTLIMVGRLISAYVCHRAMKLASVRSLQPTTVTVANLTGWSSSCGKALDVRLLQHGDVFEVEANSPVVTDGHATSILSYIDESMVTGEPAWVEKRMGSAVIAGSINRSGPLLVRVSRLPGSNSIDEMADMVNAVNFTKPKAQEVADRFARYFLPVVGFVTFSAFITWFSVGRLIQHHPTRIALLNAVLYAIAILVVSCPCAVVLAVPMVTMIACSVCVKRGMIVKSATALDIARKVTHVVFDKTGTLTESRLAISMEHYPVQPKSVSMMSLALGLTAASDHPVAATIAKHVEAQNFRAAEVDNLQSQVGKGVTGNLNGEEVRIGAASWVGEENHPAVKYALSQGYTVSCLTKGSELLAVFGLSASIREDARTTISQLLKRGIEVSIVSGDEAGAVERVARALQVDVQNTRSCYLPLQKQKYIEDLMTKPKTTVLFCGDGMNDSAALAQADVGVCISNGTDAAKTAADVVLMRPCLMRILDLIDISRDASRRVRFNFIWSALYNVVAMLFAAGAFVHARLPAAYAGLGELMSVLPVVLVALQMRWKK